MNATISQLPVQNSKARTHVTLPIEELATLLADAETMGGRRAMSMSDETERVIFLCEEAATHRARVHLYEAILRTFGT